MQISPKIDEIGVCARIAYITIFLLDFYISRRSQRLVHAPCAQKLDSDDFVFLQNHSILSRSREMC